MRLLPLLIAAVACGPTIEPIAHLQPVCERAGLPLMADLPATSLAPSQPPDAPVLVHIMEGRWRVGSSTASGVAPLVDLLQQEGQRARQMAEVTGSAAPPRVQIQASTGTPAPIVLQTLRAVRQAGLDEVDLVVFSSQPVTPTTYADPAFGSELKAELAGLSPQEAPMALVQRVQQEVGWCPGAQDVFAAIAAAPPESKCTLMAHGLQEALPSCPFTSTGRVVTLVQVMTEPRQPWQPAFISLSLDPQAPPLSLTGLTWGDAAPALVAMSGQKVSVEPEPDGGM